MAPRALTTSDLTVDETTRRQQIVDLARASTREASTVIMSRHHQDQDAWVRGQITLDELVALSQGATAHPARDREVLAVATATVTKAAVAAAATKTLQAAEQARADRSAAASEIALITARTVQQAARFLRLQADEDVKKLTSAADKAAYLVALAVVPGTEEVNAEKAASLAATNRATAVAKAEETALAAATVARAAATAAADAAAAAADAAMALELQVADTAAAVQAVATATARQVAIDTMRAADLIVANEQ
ncbi:MAG TPA: hypothetical protein VF635_18160 [Propionibacteriaceae bacterium]